MAAKRERMGVAMVARPMVPTRDWQEGPGDDGDGPCSDGGTLVDWVRLLATAVDAIGERVRSLEDRLSPVLRPKQPEEDAMGECEAMPSPSDLACQVLAATDTAHRLARWINRIDSRLDL